MARTWEEAQKNEKIFWDTIYVDHKKDIETYNPIRKIEAVDFTIKNLLRHGIDIFEKKYNSIVDLGCGPYGIIKGLQEINTNGFNLIVGVDPLMDTYKNYNLIRDDMNTKLFSSKVEDFKYFTSFNIVHSSNVLDHVDTPQKFIETAFDLTSTEGVFIVSVHCINDFLIPFKNLIKYVDKNHPHHFSKYDMKRMLEQKFSKVELKFVSNMNDDHKEFSLTYVFKNPSFRALKRYISCYVLKYYYFNRYKNTSA